MHVIKIAIFMFIVTLLTIGFFSIPFWVAWNVAAPALGIAKLSLWQTFCALFCLRVVTASFTAKMDPPK